MTKLYRRINPKDSEADAFKKMLDTIAFITKKNDHLITCKNVSHMMEALCSSHIKLQPAFLKTVSSFPDVQKLIIGFIEQTFMVKKDLMAQLISILNILLTDKSEMIAARAVQASTLIYKELFQWMSDQYTVPLTVTQAWQDMYFIKQNIRNMIGNDSEVIRSKVIEFLREIIILQSTGEIVNPVTNVLNPEQIKLKRLMQEEATSFFNCLVIFSQYSSLSCTSLIDCVETFVYIGAQRDSFIDKVTHALEHIHCNMPRSLSASQIRTVQKTLQNNLYPLLDLHLGFSDVAMRIVAMLILLESISAEEQKFEQRQCQYQADQLYFYPNVQ